MLKQKPQESIKKNKAWGNFGLNFIINLLLSKDTDDLQIFVKKQNSLTFMDQKLKLYLKNPKFKASNPLSFI